MKVSSAFIRFQWIVLVLIFLVVFAGSFVRMSGSGMGCPDWPKCFGSVIPPTSVDQLPANYQEIYLQKRLAKNDRFVATLSKLGFEETANQLANDKSIQVEEEFNATKTWTEYINRLLGFLAGNVMLLSFFWILSSKFSKNYEKNNIYIFLGKIIEFSIMIW
jgi:cytochrome c oxidase assembly protein subunit 15